jgi:outer membrane protein OmpA-like peptidoglycan-associated protein
MQQAAAPAFAPVVVPELADAVAIPAGAEPAAQTLRTASLQETENAVAFFSDAQARLSAKESCVADLRSLSEQARVYFPAGGLNADPGGIEQARLIGILLQDCKGVQIIVEGHSDPSGDADVNLKLSKKRAEQIIQRLGASGIDTMNFVAKGIGSARPSNIVGPESDAYYDRRVEFAVIEVDNTASFNRAKALSNQWSTSSCAQDLEAAIAGKNVFYSPRSVAAKQDEISVAFELAAMAMACPDARLRVIGQHSDDLRSGESPATGRLRAKAMMAMLVGQGIDSGQVIMAAPSRASGSAEQSGSRLDFDIIIE